MQIDLAQLGDKALEDGDLLRAEICIVGAGIAGLTLAHRLVQLGHDVLLLEAGGQMPDPQQDALHDVLHQGAAHRGTSEARVRALGGTSMTWGGQLLPLPKEAITWPIEFKEIAAYSKEAERLLGVDSLPYDGERFFDEIRRPMPELVKDLPLLELSLSKFAPFARRNLARGLGGALRAHPKARVVLHAVVTELLMGAQRDHIEAAIIRTPSGKTHRVAAANFVVAAGTVESVRLLLASRTVAPEGVGNQHDLVGRNFHDHLTITAASLRGRGRGRLLAEMRPWVVKDTLHSIKLAASRQLCEQLSLTPVIAHLTIDEPEGSGVGAVRGFLRAQQQGKGLRAFADVLPRLPEAAGEAARLAWWARMRGRRYVSPRAEAILRLNAAQQTPSFSRITLSEERDVFGQPKAVVDWRIHPKETATLRTFAAHLRLSLESAGAGSGLDWNAALFPSSADEPLPGLDDARHAMGGACMGADPRSSVVTPELRVHGLRNLFVASAAVFPDGSPQLPTLPLMALTLRLAGQLHRQSQI